MKLSRRISLFMCSFMLRSFLFIGLSSLALTMVFARPEHIKNALADSHAYSRIVDVAIESAKQQPQNAGSVPFDDPEVQRIIRSSFESAQLLNSSESVIDSVYTWLNGKTSEIQFRADLTQNKVKLANDLSGYAIERIGSLPVCKSIPKETNVFELSCLPPFVDLSEQRIILRDTILASKSFMPDTVLTAQNLPKNSKGQPVTEAFAKAPTYFAWFKALPYMLLGLSFLLASGVILLNRTKRAGIRQVARALVGTGVGLIITPLVYSLISPRINRSLQSNLGTDSGASGIVNDVYLRLYSDINTTLINIGIQVMALGLIVLIVMRYMKPPSGYADLAFKAGLANSIGGQKKPRDDKLSKERVPVQTSEAPYARRLPRKMKRKYKKIQF